MNQLYVVKSPFFRAFSLYVQGNQYSSSYFNCLWAYSLLHALLLDCIQDGPEAAACVEQPVLSSCQDKSGVWTSSRQLPGQCRTSLDFGPVQGSCQASIGQGWSLGQFEAAASGTYKPYTGWVTQR